MRSLLGKTFDRRIAWLRKHFPLKGKKQVLVRTAPAGSLRIDKETVQGFTHKMHNGNFLIVVERSQMFVATDTLLHEWAHAHAMQREGILDDPINFHSPLWGRIYARIYRRFTKEKP